MKKKTNGGMRKQARIIQRIKEERIGHQSLSEARIKTIIRTRNSKLTL